MFTHNLTARRGPVARIIGLLALSSLLALSAACGTESTGSGGTDAGGAADSAATDAGGADGSAADATAVGADATSADAGATPDAVKTTPADLVKIANANVAQWADDGSERVGFLPQSKSGKELAQQNCSAEAPPSSSGGGSSGGGSSGGGSSGGGGDNCKPDEYDAVKTAKDIKEWFAEQLFDAKFVDAKQTTDKLVVLCLTPENACDKQTDNQGNQTIDAKCAKGLTTTPVCLALTHHGGQLLTGELRVGNTPALVPATFVLNPEKISVKVDLSVALEATKNVMKAMEEELPEAFPETATGALSLILERDNAATMLSALLHIDKAIHVGALKVSDAQHYDVKIAQAASALSVVFGKDKQAVQVGAKLGAIDVVAALDLFSDQGDETCSSGSTGSGSTGSGSSGAGSSGAGSSGAGSSGGGSPGGAAPGNCNTPPKKPLTGRLIAALAGAHFSLTFVAGKDVDTAAVSGLGFGATTSTVKFHDGTTAHPLLTLDLNADAKRMVDLVVAYTGKKIDLVTTPKLDVKVGHTMKVLNPQFDNDIPEFLHKGTSAVRFDGDAKPTFVFETESKGKTTTPLPTPGGGSSGGSSGGSGAPGGSADSGDDFPPMKVLAGLLTLKAAGLPTGMSDVLVTVKAGMCLGQKPKDSSGGGGAKDQPQHFFGQLAQVVCKP